MEKFRAFLDQAHSVYHVATGLEQMLRAEGYCRLDSTKSWQLESGGKYYLVRNGSAVLAFRIPETVTGGFTIAAAHNDRPGFKVKENPELRGAYRRVAVERYGGMLMHTWLDRPLSIAGRVMVETQEGISSRLIDIDRDLLMIPNVAIHMNRKANEGYSWNPAVDMIPLAGMAVESGKLWRILEEAAGGRIIGHDLYLYIRQKSSLWGVEEELLSAAGLDDLACVYGCLQGFLQAQDSGSIPVFCAFDSEEVGSGSLQGAASDFLAAALERICGCLGLSSKQMLASSFMVSADNAHALHPNHPEYADPANAPVLGQGVAVKFNANQRYTSDGLSAGLFRRICARAGVSLQTYCNRADMLGGSTLGNISLSQVSVPCVDIGIPQLAMHSCFETVAVEDIQSLCKAMEAVFSSKLTFREDGVSVS